MIQCAGFYLAKKSLVGLHKYDIHSQSNASMPECVMVTELPKMFESSYQRQALIYRLRTPNLKAYCIMRHIVQLSSYYLRVD